MQTLANITPQVEGLPEEILPHITAADWRVFSHITTLCRLTASKSPKKALYAFSGQAYLAGRLNMRRETVSRSVQRLQRFGLLTITHRRRWRGRWMTNLYKLGPTFWRAMKRGKAAVAAALDHVTSQSHIARTASYNGSRQGPISVSQAASAALDEMRSRLRGSDEGS